MSHLNVALDAPFRDPLLDCLRGLALVIIVVDHIGPNVLSQFTPQMFGFSDMADLFVLLSGISCGITYSRRLVRDGFWSAQSKSLWRASQIYMSYVAAMSAILPMTWLYQSEYPTYDSFFDPQSNVLNFWNVMLMIHSWGALPILKLYMVYLVVTPLLTFLCGWSRSLVLCASATVYVAVNIYSRVFDYTWSRDPLFVNPWAWQFLFVIGLTSGAFRPNWKWPICRDRRVALLAAIFLEIAFAVKIVQPSNIPGTANTELGPLRILHLCALMIAVSWAASRPWGRWLILSFPSRLMQILGRNSLFAFCIGEVLVAMAKCYVKYSGYSTASQILGSLVAIGLMWGLTRMFALWQTRGREAKSNGSEEIGATLGKSPLIAGDPTVQS